MQVTTLILSTMFIRQTHQPLSRLQGFLKPQKHIESQIDKKRKLKKKLIEFQSTVMKEIDTLLKETKRDVNKLKELNLMLNEQEYYKFNEDLEYIKVEDQIKKNSKIMDVMNEFENLCNKQANMSQKDGNQLKLGEIIESYIDRKSMKKLLSAMTWLFPQTLINLMHLSIKVFGLLNKGCALSGLNRYSKAIKCYDKAIGLKPDNVAALQKKGIALYDLKQYEEAIKCFDKVIQLDPNNAQAYEKKGNSLDYQMKYKEANQCYERAIELEPNNYELYQRLNLEELNEKEEAIQCYQIAREKGGPDQLLQWIQNIRAK